MGLFTLAPLVTPPSTALLYGAATSDAVDIGSNAIIDDLDPFTMFAWVRFTTFTSNRGLYQKFSGGSTNWRISGTAGDVQLAVTRATTITSYITNSAPLALGAWCFLAVTYNSAAGTSVAHIYGGSLVLPATECTYGTSQDGSGSVSSNAGANGKVGNNATTTNAMQGDYASFAIANRVFSLPEIRMIQRWMLEWGQGPVIYPGLVAAYALGANGVKVQRDLTGNKNDGTVTGSTVTRGIVRPSRQRIGYIQTEPPGGASTFNDSRTESLTAAETETATLDAVVAETESLAASESAVGALSAVTATTESLTATATDVGVLVAPVARTESLAAADGQDATVVSGGDAVTDSASASDTSAATTSFVASASETLTATDNLSATVVYAAPLSESLAPLDTPAAIAALAGAVTESLSAVDVNAEAAAVAVGPRPHQLAARSHDTSLAARSSATTLAARSRETSLAQR